MVEAGWGSFRFFPRCILLENLTREEGLQITQEEMVDGNITYSGWITNLPKIGSLIQLSLYDIGFNHACSSYSIPHNISISLRNRRKGISGNLFVWSWFTYGGMACGRDMCFSGEEKLEKKKYALYEQKSWEVSRLL